MQQDWGALPGLVLRCVMQQLSKALAQDALDSSEEDAAAAHRGTGGGGTLSVPAALAAAAAAAPNMHWSEVAKREVRPVLPCRAAGLAYLCWCCENRTYLATHPALCAQPPAAQLSLAVHCDGSTAQLHALLWLAGRARLTALRFCQAQDDGAAAAAVFELLTHRPLIAAAGRHLRALAGVPSASVAGGRREQAHPFPLAAFPALQALQFYVPPQVPDVSSSCGGLPACLIPSHPCMRSHHPRSQPTRLPSLPLLPPCATQLQVLSLRDGGAGWGGAAALRRLDVSGRHYVAVRALPPHLRHLSVSAWHVLLEPRVRRGGGGDERLWLEKGRLNCLVGRLAGSPQVHAEAGCPSLAASQIAYHMHSHKPPSMQVVACCAHVEVHAEAVLLSEHVLPYASLAGAATAAAAAQQLAELAAALAGAGLPPGHEMRLTTNLVCFQTVPCHDSTDAKLVAPRAQAVQAAEAAGGAAAAADGGATAATLAFAPQAAAASGVSATLAPAPGSALNMLVVLRGA